MRRRAVDAMHFYGVYGDPGGPDGRHRQRGVAGAAPIMFKPEKAIAWAIDRIERPIIDDPHPGRVVVCLREGKGHGVSCDVWVRPSVTSPGRAVVDIHKPQIWGYCS